MNAFLGRLQLWDARASSLLAGQVRSGVVVRILQISSQVGNFWISVLSGLLLVSDGAPRLSLRLVSVSLLALVLQKMLKASASRIRPCLLAGGPEQRAPIPDVGSFPSGHALHAVLCAIVVVHQIPHLAFVYLPLALLVAVSRVALGVHYPADVAAGAIMGTGLAALVLFA